MMMMAGYMLFNSYFRGGSSSSKTTDAGSETSTYGDVDAEFGSQTGRRFKDLNGMWVSYMQSDSKADSLLLLLHRTSSSAEGDYGSAFPQLAKTTASAGFRMLAPDRPCHGFSPCLSDGEPDDAATWLAPLMRIGGTPDKLAVVAAGREAAQQAIALAAKPGKAEFTHLLVVSPKALAPATQITKSAEMHDWLNKHTKKLSPQAIADAAKWAAAEAQRKQPKLAPLSVNKLPQDFRVTILYGEGDEEDEEFRQALENQGVEVKTRDAGENTLSDTLVDEVQQALNPDGSGVEKDQRGETDEE
jgi:pimeloyl-ACP methyl ester carboxylesterase